MGILKRTVISATGEIITQDIDEDFKPKPKVAANVRKTKARKGRNNGSTTKESPEA